MRRRRNFRGLQRFFLSSSLKLAQRGIGDPIYNQMGAGMFTDIFNAMNGCIIDFPDFTAFHVFRLASDDEPDFNVCVIGLPLR
jgi:hypothetical protein